MGRITQKLKVGVRGSLDVVIEKTSVSPGGTLSGLVRLHADKPIVTHGLDVVFAGRERLEWDELNDDPGHPHNEKSVVHEDKMALLDSPGTGNTARTLEAGVHEYPFTFQIPQRLPESFTYTAKRIQGMDRVFIAVVYDVTASLLVDGFLKADLECIVPIEVRADSPQIHHCESFTTFKSDETKLLGIIKKGACDVILNVRANVLDATSTIVAHVDVSHSSNRELKSLKLSLVEDIEIDRKCYKTIRTGSRVLCSRFFEKRTLEAMATDTISSFALELPVTPNDVYGVEPLLPSMNSHFIVSLRYRVVLECKFPLSRRIEVDAPVTFVRTS
ncbi:hypothetical protein Poli38472_010132 [Pythium oligandrum]|uniref:Arrestin-like N-terminal domain-containing protein n=1 Tax=Pythium oligandrum TaxID=41045 RepID=A0A8K1FHA2_PYTOL|nr:hypothetical protein Poli38472_010132 [Pythium oligandrum]|eukprot:TMW58573.1 hypothetical protein Poli38472_010132 [Pythium oligandrum]